MIKVEDKRRQLTRTHTEFIIREAEEEAIHSLKTMGENKAAVVL